MTDNIMLDDQAYTGLTTRSAPLRCGKRTASRPPRIPGDLGPRARDLPPFWAHLEPNEEHPNICQVVPPQNIRDGRLLWKTTSTGNGNKPWSCSC